MFHSFYEKVRVREKETGPSVDPSAPLFMRKMLKRIQSFFPTIFSGRTAASNAASSMSPLASAASFSVRPFLWAVFAIAAALS